MTYVKGLTWSLVSLPFPPMWSGSHGQLGERPSEDPGSHPHPILCFFPCAMPRVLDSSRKK